MKIITAKDKTNTTIRQNMLNSISIPVTVYDDISHINHDRYWIVESKEKCVNVGTSLNGVGKKITVAKVLTKADTREIINALRSITTTFQLYMYK